MLSPLLWSDDSAQDIAEYAVMLAVILVLVVGTVRLVGTNANNVFSSVASSVQYIMSVFMVFEFVCKQCGQLFSASLREIVRGGGRITCPHCGRGRDYNFADVYRPAA